MKFISKFILHNVYILYGHIFYSIKLFIKF